MRAMVQTGFGGPDVVTLREVHEPRPGPHEVLVRVDACALNHLDLIQRRGPGVLLSCALPHIPSMDIAGAVVGVGRSVVAPAEATRVAVDPTSGCGVCPVCTSGYRGYCERIRAVGGNIAGGLAEFVVVPAASTVPVPEHVALAEAPTLPTTWSTAWNAVHGVARLAPGECVVIQAGASAISLAAIALAKRGGAAVIAVASTDEKLTTAAAAAGADHGVRNDADVVSAVLDLTAGRGADVALDHVGAATWNCSLAAVKVGGRVVMLGNTSGDEVRFSLANVYHRGLRLLGAGAYAANEFVAALTAPFDDGLRSIRAGTFDLQALPSAGQTLEEREAVGKVLVCP